MNTDPKMSSSSSCVESFGNQVETFIAGLFHSLGGIVGRHPRKTILASIVLTVIMGYGFTSWETENRGEELWVPQDTIAEEETGMYQSYFPSSSRFNSLIVEGATTNSSVKNVLTKSHLEEAMKLHKEIETGVATVDDVEYSFLELCTKAGESCVSKYDGVCQCLVTSILKQWNYDLETLQADDDIMATINKYGSQEDLEAILGNPTFVNDALSSAEAFTVNYFIESRSEVVDGTEVDPINEGWELDVFLAAAEAAPEEYTSLSVDYIASRSFGDEFGGAITGDLLLVQVSYVVAFLFLAANLGYIKCGTGSRWTMAFSALMVVGLSTAAGFGLSSICGLFFGPVHSILPFILLGIGVDDAFVIVNAFNRERKVPRASEDNEALAKRAARGLARAGASITVTSMTDIAAFGISSSSSLPALASFCAYAAISIFFLWLFASTFFSATLVLDERRQRDNRRECLCCLTRKKPMDDEEDEKGFQEDSMSRYFRNYHAPAILSKIGKVIVLTIFAGLFGFGVWGALNLTVEDSERSFVPEDSYLNDYFKTADEYYPSTGIDLYIVFEDSADIYQARQKLADLDVRLTNLSKVSPYIAEPVSEKAYKNVMQGLYLYLNSTGSEAIGNVTLGEDGWPTTSEDFVATLANYTSFTGPGRMFGQDVSFSNEGVLEAIKVQSEYVRLTKLNAGEIIDDADLQIEAMDDTRALVASWDDLPSAFPYSEKFIAIEGFKIIKKELFMNVGLAILAVGVIVFFTLASPVTSILITLNVAFCIVEILGFMYAFNIVIDSVSVINMVLAVGLSVDYSAHVGHCFMVKGGDDKNKRALEALADMGAAVLNGAISTFLAVVVLLFSSSYVFRVLSAQFALTVALGIAHGLVLLPVMLSFLGPKAFASAEQDSEDADDSSSGKPIAETSHAPEGEDNSSEDGNKKANEELES